MFRKSLLVGFCVVVGVLFSVFSIFSITSFGYCSRSEHQETNKKYTKIPQLRLSDEIDHFRVPKILTFKMRPSAEP